MAEHNQKRNSMKKIREECFSENDGHDQHSTNNSNEVEYGKYNKNN